jgi:LysM repeat protein
MFSESFDAIQGIVAHDTTFYNLCQTIISNLSDIDDENNKIQSGQSTVFDTMPTLLTDLLANVESCMTLFLNLFLTSTQITNYNLGTFTIDEVLDISVVTFYNSLQKLRLVTEGSQGIINSTVKTSISSYYANADDYTITNDQFDTETDTVTGRVMDKSSYEYYTVQAGDTARIVAYRHLYDAEKYIAILQINEISESSFIDGSLIGQQIKIPVTESGLSRNPNNLVYDSDDSNILTFLHGKDIRLDINKKMMPDPKGDMLSLDGPDNAYAAVMDRLNNPKGSLNVFAPGWGITSLGDGNAPLMVRVERYLSDLIGQIQSDPRVATVSLNLDKLKFQGEALYVQGNITFLGNDDARSFEVVQ